MNPSRRWLAGLFTVGLLVEGCRSVGDPPVSIEDAATVTDSVDGASSPDVGATDDVVTSSDVPAAMDISAMDVPAIDDVPSAADTPTATDVPADVRRPDAGRTCVCPTLPATCMAPAADTPAFSPESALLNQLMGVISCANTSLHIALYETLWECVPDALLARLTAAPGLTVQLVYDDETCPRVAGTLMCPLARLDGHPRVSMSPDGRTGALMHHKYVVADGARVWVGSANSSENSYCRDANDAVVIDDAPVVTAFDAEFVRMFRDRSFGPIASTGPAMGGRYAAYFSPRSPASSPARWFTDMVGAIGEARTSVEFIISAWTRTELSDAMVAARARGVTVRGIVGRMYLNDPPARALLAASIAVRSGDVHSKLLLIDGQVVITGSANWSAAAWSNNENSLWIRDASAASAYGTFFERQYAVATVPMGM